MITFRFQRYYGNRWEKKKKKKKKKRKKKLLNVTKVRSHLKLVLSIVTMELLKVRKKQGYNQMWQKYSQEWCWYCLMWQIQINNVLACVSVKYTSALSKITYSQNINFDIYLSLSPICIFKPFQCGIAIFINHFLLQTYI